MTLGPQLSYSHDCLLSSAAYDPHGRPHATLPVSSNIFSEVLLDEAHMDPILPCC